MHKLRVTATVNIYSAHTPITLPFDVFFIIPFLHFILGSIRKPSITMAPPTLLSETEAPSASHCWIRDLPVELLCKIIDYTTEGSRTALLPAAKLPAITQLSLFRNLYLQYESENDFGIGARPMPTGGKRHHGTVYSKPRFRPLIGETLSFPDLKTMAKCFARASSGYEGRLAEIKFIRIVYQDNAKSAWDYMLEYAYEAFELLCANLAHMPLLQRLQVVANGFYNGLSVETPGIWSLLKVRGLQAVILTGRAWSQNKCVANAVRNRLKRKPGLPWRPLGFEKPGTRHWPRVRQLGFEEQWQWLEERYQDLQDRKVVTERRLQQRRARDRRYGTTQLGRARRRFVVIWKKRCRAREHG